MTTTQPGAGLGFDPGSLRAQYRTERDRRLRADGNEQYRECERAERNVPYGAGAFVKVLEDWRAAGTLAGLEIHGT